MTNPYDWAQTKANEIESEFPPSRCSLEEYRDHLRALHEALAERLVQLDEEIEG